MSITDVGKACTFSGISGFISNNGKPVANAKITRITDWQNESIDETITNSDGYFSMPALFENKVVGVLPQQFSVKQVLTVELDGRPVKIWSGVKMSKIENSESKGQKLEVTCDLAIAEKIISVDGQPFITLCKWDVEPDKPITADDFFSTDDE